MSLVGQVLWKRSVIGALSFAGAGAGVVVCGVVGAGALRSPLSSLPQAATPAATPTAPTAPAAVFFRKLRRVVAGFAADGTDVLDFIRAPVGKRSASAELAVTITVGCLTVLSITRIV